jgi:hypothetical protein
MAKLSGKVNGMDVHRTSQSGHWGTLFRIVQCATRPCGQVPVQSSRRAEDREQLRQRIIVLSDQSQPGAKRNSVLGPRPLSYRFRKTLPIGNHSDDDRAIVAESICVTQSEWSGGNGTSVSEHRSSLSFFEKSPLEDNGQSFLAVRMSPELLERGVPHNGDGMTVDARCQQYLGRTHGSPDSRCRSHP